MDHSTVQRINKGKTRFGYLASWWVWAFAILCLGLNYLFSFLIGLTNAPIYLDCIGTIICSALCGSIPGMLVGFCTNLLNCISDPMSIYYSVASIAIAFTTAFFAHKGYLRHLWGWIVATLIFIFFGGVVCDLFTYFLYGSGIGSGVSGSWAHAFNNAGMSVFWSQMFADILCDLIDKPIEVIASFLFLRFMPKNFLLLFPNGEDFATNKPVVKKKFNFLSIENKMTIIVLVSAIVVGFATAYTLTTIYTNKANENYSTTGNNYSALVSSMLSYDNVNEANVDKWLTPTGTDADGNPTYTKDEAYEEEVKKLETVYESSTSNAVAYIYVYKIEDDGCHVVFDIDTSIEGDPLGYVIPFEDAFSPYLDDLKAGNEIPNITSKDEYGWLLTSYSPIKEKQADGTYKTVAYAGVDINMNALSGDIQSFVTKILSIEISLILLVLSIAHYVADTRLVKPINAVLEQTKDYTRIGPNDWLSSPEYKNRDKRYAKDEIGMLYSATDLSEEDISKDLTMIEQQAATILKMERNVVYTLAEMVESRDECTGEHIKRTSLYVGMIAKELQKEGTFRDEINDEFVQNLIVSAPLHDVGKIKISDTILNKKGKLTDEEFAMMKTHVTEGGKIISMALEGITGDTYLDMAKDVATYHHERWDGKGYMAGLKGEEIPLSARIMAVADVFDALVSKRSYKEPFPFDEAISIIESESGTHFDPRIVKAFVNIKEEVRESLKSK